MNQIISSPLKLPQLLKAAHSLKTSGHLAISSNNLTYLDIQDEFIHELYPLLGGSIIHKPAYFGENGLGAHMTVIYPEENITMATEELGTKHHFTIKGLYSAELPWKTYIVLMVECPSLIELRHRYGLPEQLNFRNHWIYFHITIGYQTK